MKTQEDVLSFHDLDIQGALNCIVYQDKIDGIADVVLQSLKNVTEMSDRLIHTFLEWDLYDSYIYNLGWSLTYTASKSGQPPIITGTRVDTLQEAEIMAIKKVSRFIGEQVHLESMKESSDISHPSPYDTFYKVLNRTDEYCGMVEIARMEQLK